MNNSIILTDEILDLEGASKLTGYSKHTLYGKSSRGDIPVYNTGGKLLFFKSELLEFIKSHKKKRNPGLHTAA